MHDFKIWSIKNSRITSDTRFIIVKILAVNNTLHYIHTPFFDTDSIKMDPCLMNLQKVDAVYDL